MVVEVIAEVEAVAQARSIEQGEMQDLMTDTRPEHEIHLCQAGNSIEEAAMIKAAIMVGKINLESQGR